MGVRLVQGQAAGLPAPADPATNATTRSGLAVKIPGAGDVFRRASEDGTISGWRGALGSNAETLRLAATDNVYKGAALATITGNAWFYAVNFKQGRTDVLPGSAGAPALPGSFTDPDLRLSGLAAGARRTRR